MPPVFDTAIINCGELLTLAGKHGPRCHGDQSEIGLITHGAVGIIKGKIAWVGRQEAYQRNGRAQVELDAKSQVVMPGLVDPHTHAVFAGTRETEWIQKIAGASYLELLQQGGGILSTVEATRATDEKSLYDLAEKRLKKMLAYGTTTVEIKSGYGLNLENEIKILKVIQTLKKRLPMDIVATFMGGHTLPMEYLHHPEAYVNQVIEMLPHARPYADFCDLFCEEGAFSPSQGRKIFKAAKASGFKIKLHAGQFSDQSSRGGIKLAKTFSAISVDHLDMISPQDIARLKKSGAVGVMLPGVSHFLGTKKIPPTHALIEAGIPIALATDFNPGTSPCLSMQEMIHLAVQAFRLSPEEAIVASTINAAHAIGMANNTGSLEVGKQADLIFLDLDRYAQLPYFFGVNHVTLVMKKGKVAYTSFAHTDKP